MRILYTRVSPRTNKSEVQAREFSRAAYYTEAGVKYLDVWGGDNGGCLRFNLSKSVLSRHQHTLTDLAHDGFADLTGLPYQRIASHSSINQYDPQLVTASS